MVRSQNLHNELLKICTTNYSKYGQIKKFKKSIDFFLLLTIIEYERSKKVKGKNKKENTNKHK